MKQLVLLLSICLSQAAFAQAPVSTAAPYAVSKKACESAAAEYLVQQDFVGDSSVQPLSLDQYVRLKAMLEYMLQKIVGFYGQNYKTQEAGKNSLPLLQRYQGLLARNLVRLALSRTPNRMMGSDSVYVKDVNGYWPYQALVFGYDFFEQFKLNLFITEGDLIANLMCYHFGANQYQQTEECLKLVGYPQRLSFWEAMHWLYSDGVNNVELNSLLYEAGSTQQKLMDEFEANRIGVVSGPASEQLQAENLEFFETWKSSASASTDYSRLIPFADACMDKGYLKRPTPGLMGPPPPPKESSGKLPEEDAMTWFLTREIVSTRPAYTQAEWTFVEDTVSQYQIPSFAAFADGDYFYYSFVLNYEDRYIRVPKAKVTADRFRLAGFKAPNRVVLNALEITIIGAGRAIRVPFVGVSEEVVRGRRQNKSEIKLEAAYAKFPVISEKDYKLLTEEEFMAVYEKARGYNFSKVNYL